MNFQDVIRDVHDPANHRLQTSGGAGNTTVFVGTPTLYAVVNTGASSGNVTLNPSPNYIGLTTSTPVKAWPDPKTYIGLVTVTGDFATSGNMTVNPGPNQIGSVTVSHVVESITTIAPRTDFIGLMTVTVGAGGAGFQTVFQGGAPWNSLVTVNNKDRTITGNLTLSDPKGYIGLVSISHAAWANPNTYIGLTTSTLGVGTRFIGLTTSWVSGIAGNLTLSDSKGFIGLTTVTGSNLDIRSLNSTATLFAVVNTSAAGQSSVVLDTGTRWIGLATVIQGNSLITVTLGTKLDSTNDSVDIKSGATVTMGNTPTVFVGTPTLYAVVNTSAAGQASVVLDTSPNFIGIVTVSNKDRNITGNLTLSDSKGFIGLTTVTGSALDIRSLNSTATLFAVVNTSAAGQSSVVLDTGANWIGIATVWQASTTRSIVGNLTLSDSKQFIGLATVVIGSGGAGFQTVFQGGAPWESLVTVNNKDRTITGNLTLSDSKSYIGLVSVSGFANPLPVSQSGTWDIGTLTSITNTVDTAVKGNLTLSDSKQFIGLTTVTGSALDIRSLNSTATLFAVVNTSAAGQASIVIDGNVTLSDSKGFIGLTTVTGSALDVRSLNSTATLFAVVNTAAAGQSSVVLDTGANWVGLVTANISNAVGNATLNPSPNYIGLVTADIGTIKAWANPNTYIGLVTASLGIGTQKIGLVTLSASNANIGSVSVLGGSIGLNASSNYVGLASVNIGGTLPALSASNAFIGIVTVTNRDRTITGNLTLSDSTGYIGLTTTTLGVGTRFVGLVTANSINTGTNKTIIHKNIELSTSSVATLYVATNTWKATQLLVNSNATVRVSIKSGVTYLTGNASIGVVLNPGGGWVESGSPDSPIYQALTTTRGIVVEKLDLTATVANVAGKIMFFDE